MPSTGCKSRSLIMSSLPAPHVAQAPQQLNLPPLCLCLLCKGRTSCLVHLYPSLTAPHKTGAAAAALHAASAGVASQSPLRGLPPKQQQHNAAPKGSSQPPPSQPARSARGGQRWSSSGGGDAGSAPASQRGSHTGSQANGGSTSSRRGGTFK